MCPAEDGIRDLVRSRGLGDVYKRQVLDVVEGERQLADEVLEHRLDGRVDLELVGLAGAVSYTHLTLPTSDLV